jgi:SAM-dependent methyltransferase
MAGIANVVQAELWNGAEGRDWAERPDRYETMLAPFGARVLDAVALRPGDRVLDVGCGAGDLARAAADRVGADGRVEGIDLSEPLVETARRRTGGQGQVTYTVDDAQIHPFLPGGIDVVVSRFGVMFFDDPVAAFTNLAIALRPGGRLGFVCWQDAAANEWMLTAPMAALAHLPPPDPAMFEVLSPFGFADPGRVAGILGEAGFVDITCTGVEQMLLFGGARTLDDAVEFFRVGLGASLLTGAGPEQVDAALVAVRDALAPHVTARGVELGAAAWLVTAATTVAGPLM